MCVYTEICISATTERLSQPAVTWHIMSHIIRQSKMTFRFCKIIEITKSPYRLSFSWDDVLVYILYYYFFSFYMSISLYLLTLSDLDF